MKIKKTRKVKGTGLDVIPWDRKFDEFTNPTEHVLSRLFKRQ